MAIQAHTRDYFALAMKKLWNKQTYSSVFIVVFVALCILYILNVYRIEDSARSLTGAPNGEFERNIVNTPGCRIPDLDVMHGDAKKFYKKLAPVECSSKKPLTYVKDGLLCIDPEARKLYGKIRCCYSYIYRVAQNWTKYNREADNKIRYGDCKAFDETVNLTEDFVKVECTQAGKSVYKNMHALIPRNRLPKSARGPEAKPSVFIIGLDSLSRLNFRRQMPQTLHFLQQLGFIEYFGYNKIGDNTFPNLVGVLSGRTIPELKEVCWKTRNYPMDECPLVWKNFSFQLNYTTFYAEDMPTWGTFYLNKLGFLAPPTDFYYRPYAIAVEQLGERSDQMCYGYEHSVEHVLDYTRAFAMAHRHVPFFALSWTVRLSHNDLNEPQLADPLYYELLSTLYANGIFENAIVLFMGDHGLRFGDFRETYLGYMEERLPVLWTKFPDWFSSRYPKAVANFRENAYKLTSPFDLHQTILDLFDVNQLIEPSVTNRAGTLHGQSLFTEISAERTCSQAGIDDIWCACYQHVPVPISDPIVASASTFVVQTLNNWLVDETKCEKLTLSEILQANVRTNNILNWVKEANRKYLIRLRTVPGDAELEATVEFDTKLRKLSLMDQVSRLNRYDGQSNCMDDAVLKLYCYCKH